MRGAGCAVRTMNPSATATACPGARRERRVKARRERGERRTLVAAHGATTDVVGVGVLVASVRVEDQHAHVVGVAGELSVTLRTGRSAQRGTSGVTYEESCVPGSRLGAIGADVTGEHRNAQAARLGELRRSAAAVTREALKRPGATKAAHHQTQRVALEVELHRAVGIRPRDVPVAGVVRGLELDLRAARGAQGRGLRGTVEIVNERRDAGVVVGQIDRARRLRGDLGEQVRVRAVAASAQGEGGNRDTSHSTRHSCGSHRFLHR